MTFVLLDALTIDGDNSEGCLCSRLPCVQNDMGGFPISARFSLENLWYGPRFFASTDCFWTLSLAEVIAAGGKTAESGPWGFGSWSFDRGRLKVLQQRHNTW